MRWFRLIALLAWAIAILNGCGGVARPQSARTFAPYVEVSVAAEGLHSLAREANARELTLAFVVSARRRCEAAWDDGSAIFTPAVRRVAASERLAVSFGGQSGADLATWCRTPETLARRYWSVIAGLRARRADFDIEGDALLNHSAMDRRARGIAELQARARVTGRPLAVSLTLPVEPTGLPPQSRAALQTALSAGVQVTKVNLLAMDYGASRPATTPGTLGLDTIAAATAAARQLHRLLPRISRSEIWRMVGITTMIGRNDVTSEVFTTADADEVLRFARKTGIGLLSFWSLNRDHSCATGGSAGTGARDDCSGVRQSPFEFTRLFERLGH